MKILSSFFVTCIIVLSYSCNKTSINGPMNVSEVYIYTDQANTKCTEKIKNETKEIVLTGFIDKSNINVKNKCFDVFEGQDNAMSKRIQIIITDNSKIILDKILKKLGKVGENEFIKIKIKGIIIGKQLYINGGCIMGTYITISNLNCITF